MAFNIENLPVTELRPKTAIAASGTGQTITLQWSSGATGPFKQVDNIEANDILLTEIPYTASARLGAAKLEGIWLTNGVSTYLSDGIREVTYTLSVRGILNTNSENPPTTSYTRNYRGHLAQSFGVCGETWLVRNLKSVFESETTNETVTAGEAIDTTSGALGVSLHTDNKYYKYSATYTNFQGVAEEGQTLSTNDAFVLKNLKGSSILNTGLTAGALYYAEDGGALTTTFASGVVFLGKAKNDTQIDHALQFNASAMSDAQVTAGTDTDPQLISAAQIKLGAADNTTLSSYVNEVAVAGDILGVITQKGSGGAGSVNNWFGRVYSEKKIATAFIASGDIATDFELYVKKVGSPTDNAVCRIETDNSGEPSGTLANANLTASVVGTSLNTSMVITTFTFTSPTALTKGQIYWVVLERSGSLNSSNFYEAGASNISATSSANFSRQKRSDSGGWVSAFTTTQGWGMDNNAGVAYWGNAVLLRTNSTLSDYAKASIDVYAPFAGIAQNIGSGYIGCLVFGKDTNQVGLTTGSVTTWNDVSGLAVSETEYLIPEIKDYSNLDIE